MAGVAVKLHLSPVPDLAESRRLHGRTNHHYHPSFALPSIPRTYPSISIPLLLPRSANPSLSQTLPSTDPPAPSSGGPSKPPHGPSDNGRGGGGGDGAPGDDHHSEEPRSSDPGGPLGLFLEGWRSRVTADPQFPFKVLMEELVGVTANVIGDMASRPNFGLNELDFVFSTLVVGSIVNFVLMYLLAPTAASAAASSALPGIFASCPTSHMFQPGPYSLFSRLGTFLYKGATFAAVGFAAGLAGTAISNGLIALRKRMDPAFETPNKPPPTVLNALTWSLHLGLSSNFRYQTLNGLEFLMEKTLPSAGFKASVVVLRCLNNVLGGMTFVMLARLTGSQKAGESEEETGEIKEKLVSHCVPVAEDGDGESQRSES
ncbi:protein RETICULATA-RELATED 3, chloroplastic-like [Musa acuminata AAA Group]|uniref:protein RETICULATA-RELATED 3, chloroplastic-like n=1 Tax=Musa acuminata AAA Group TaxID=214697 RepID=UPI0031D95BD6